jgi:hypothetical protein
LKHESGLQNVGVRKETRTQVSLATPQRSANRGR